MRNKYAGPCYRCGQTVAPMAGHFERHEGKWRVQHAGCAIDARKLKPATNNNNQPEKNMYEQTNV